MSDGCPIMHTKIVSLCLHCFLCVSVDTSYFCHLSVPSWSHTTSVVSVDSGYCHGWEIAVILRNFRKTKLSKSKFLFFFFSFFF